MKALILLGGLGTRLRPFTLNKPKPLLPVLNKPFFSYQLGQLKKHGIKDVILALGYQAAHFKRHLGNGRAWGMKFTYSQEETPLGTGGAIRKAYPLLNGPTFILNGDVLCNVDFSKLLKTHRAKKADGTLTLVAVKDPSAFGLIETDAAGKIRKFIEKPSAEEMTVNTINAGFYLFELPVIRYIPENQPVSIERDVFPKLLKNGYTLGGYVHNGYWSDIGTLKSYWDTHMDLMDNISESLPADVKKLREGLWAGAGTKLHNAIKVQGTAILGPKCRVAANVVFRGRVCLGARCVIGENVHLSDCVVHEGTVIGSDTQLENCLVGEDCEIGDNCHVGPNEVLANGSVLKPYSRQVAGLLRSPEDKI
jgi:mannose-1-phosphate guanylyltransferase